MNQNEINNQNEIHFLNQQNRKERSQLLYRIKEQVDHRVSCLVYW